MKTDPTPHDEEDAEVARHLWEQARENGQAVFQIEDDLAAAELRGRVRRLAAADDIRIRTARMGDVVAVVRLDAPLWNQDAATMRRALSVAADAGTKV